MIDSFDLMTAGCLNEKYFFCICVPVPVWTFLFGSWGFFLLFFFPDYLTASLSRRINHQVSMSPACRFWNINVVPPLKKKVWIWEKSPLSWVVSEQVNQLNTLTAIDKSHESTSNRLKLTTVWRHASLAADESQTLLSFLFIFSSSLPFCFIVVGSPSRSNSFVLAPAGFLNQLRTCAVKTDSSVAFDVAG